jgi:hypothetical protein
MTTPLTLKNSSRHQTRRQKPVRVHAFERDPPNSYATSNAIAPRRPFKSRLQQQAKEIK